MRTIGLLLWMFWLTLNTQGQVFDTLKVMTYNLLYYGEVTSFCTSSNNNINEKDEHFKIIANYVQPDLLLVNEMGASNVYGERILAKVLNVDGVDRFNKAEIKNNGFSDLVNGVFYDKTKLTLVEHSKVSKALNNSDLVRVIDVVTFRVKDPNLDASSDTTFLHLVGMHLKAGSSQSDEDERDIATEALMEFLKDNYDTGNFILAGDLNLGGSSEAAFGNLKAGMHNSYRFIDPLISGGWSGTSSFAFSHTQSTHTDGSGCASGGGLDDRFDLIMLSEPIMEDSTAVRYIEDSYTIVGNDGSHYNQTILDGTNESAPEEVLEALYGMSDHLPVTIDLQIELNEEDTTWPEGTVALAPQRFSLDVFGDQVRLMSSVSGATFSIYDVAGRVLYSKSILSKEQWLSLPQLESGIYILRFGMGANSESKKVFLTR